MEILGKPSGVTLRQHTDNVLAEGDYIASALPISFEKYLTAALASLIAFTTTG